MGAGWGLGGGRVGAGWGLGGGRVGAGLCRYAECHLCKVSIMLGIANKPIIPSVILQSFFPSVILTPGLNVINYLSTVYECSYRAVVFVPGRPIQPGIIFATFLSSEVLCPHLGSFLLEPLMLEQTLKLILQEHECL